MESIKKEKAEKNIDLIELATQLENEDDVEVIKSKLGFLLESVSEELKIPLTDNVTKLYKEMADADCLFRIEWLSKIIESLKLRKEIKIADETENHYANAVIPSPEGIKIAFSEGRAPGPVRIAVGFGKTIVGFKTDNLRVEKISFGESDIRDVKEREFLCRHVIGELKPEDIKCIVIRIPTHFIEEKYLTEKEKTSGAKFIFRGFDLFGAKEN